VPSWFTGRFRSNLKARFRQAALLRAELAERADEFGFKRSASGRGRGAPHLVHLFYDAQGAVRCID